MNMRKIAIFPMERTPAVEFAARELASRGVKIVGTLTEEVTHVLVGVPTKERVFPPGVTVIGGNLEGDFPKIDLLKEEQYLAENAAITADCALRLLGDRLPVTFRGCPILVIGWGRIGKCLAAMLKNLEADVTVAARKPADLAVLIALGYKAVAVNGIRPEGYRAILNTAPAPVLAAGGEEANIKIDLASRLGMAGENVLWARGLPGKMLPEDSGACIARGVLRHLEGLE